MYFSVNSVETVPELREADVKLTDETRQKLEAAWREKSRALMRRNGSDARFPRGGDNIAGDPILEEALHGIFKGYMPLLYAQHCIATGPGQSATKNPSPAHTALDRLVKEYTNKAYDTLQRRNYGQPGVTTEDSKPGLDPETSYRLLGSVILCTIRAFDQALGEPKVTIAPSAVVSPRPALRLL